MIFANRIFSQIFLLSLKKEIKSIKNFPLIREFFESWALKESPAPTIKSNFFERHLLNF
jgi:hypothetical protein